MAEKDLWTAPSYFNITLCGLGDDFGAPFSPLLPVSHTQLLFLSTCQRFYASHSWPSPYVT